ncbi:MAG: right-handed parallel beta-helix repeat-containing protein, partial [Candidatus ainarchaeum sp.]|nr:right-handed parallel beta-helix repeat-containing protein [Candidatus ainarchaeum sp.]
GLLLMQYNYSILERNVAYNSTDGLYIAYANGTVASNNTAFGNAHYGFNILSSFLNNFTDSLSYSNLEHGFYLNVSDNNTFLNTVSYGNLNTSTTFGNGFFTHTANNNTFRNTLLYGNGGTGLYIYASAYNVFFNTTIHSSGIHGIQLWDNFPVFGANSSGNNFTDTLIYNNSVGYGIYATTATWNHFTRTLIYNQSAYMYIASSDQPINFTNLTLGYTSTIGLINYSPLTLNLTSTALGEGDGTLMLRSYWVSLNDVGAPEANASANVTVYTPDCTYPVKRLAGYPIDLNDILTNGTIYPTNVDCTPGVDIATFNVTGFSGYALGIVPTFLTLNVTPSTTVIHGTEINVSCAASNTEVNLTIYRNDTLVQNGTGSIEYLANLSGGTYNFTCNTTGDENYTSANTSALVTVSMNTTVLTLTMPTGIIPPGTETNVSCAASNSEVNLTLFRNGVEIANGTSVVEDIQNLSAGTYLYICNTSGNENYTSAAASGTIRFKGSTSGGGGDGEECYLEVVVNETAIVGTEVPLQVFRYSEGDPTRTSLYGATVSMIYGPTVTSYTTDTQGYIHFTPTSIGTYTYAAFFGDCYDTDGTFRAVSAGPIIIGFEQGCDSTILLYREICEELPTEDPTMGALGCMQVPVAGETVQVYRCTVSGETEMTIDCTELLGTFTSDSNGEVSIPYTDGTIRIVVPETATHGEYVDYYQLLPSDVCGEQTFTTVDFDPGCQGSTITVMEAGCRELMQDLSGAQMIEQCSERPAEGMRVDVFCCPEQMPHVDVHIGDICTELVDSGFTDSSGQFITDARDCTAYIFVERPLDTHILEDTGILVTLPTTEECAECQSDSDCGQDELCRQGECVPRDQVPPEERPCTTASECPSGYGCGNSGLCTQQPVQECARDDQCGSGYLCRGDTCVDERTVIGGGGVEGGGIAGLVGSIINAVEKSFVFLMLLLALLLLLWFFFWRKRKGRRVPRTQEELIAQEAERGRQRRK